MTSFFTWRGVDYRVDGWIWGNNEGNGLIVSRDDGRAIRGAKMHPGMVQTGISNGLDRAARRALQDERTRRERASEVAS